MTGRVLSIFVATGLAVLAHVACSGGSPAGEAPKDSGSADALGSSADASAFSCDAGCLASALADATCVETVQATLVDGNGSPVAGQPLLVCGDNLCSLPGPTNAQGTAQFGLCDAMVLPALKFIGGADYASFASAITEENTVFSPITLTPLPSSGAAFPASGGSVTSGAVVLQIAAGAVTFDPSQPDDANTVAFRAVAIDLAKVPTPIPASLGIAVVWGLAPVNAALAPAATLTIPNSEGWPAGSKVDFYMNGVDPIPDAAVPYGSWGPVGSGTVSQDATTITTDTGSGNGIPILSMVGAALHS